MYVDARSRGLPRYHTTRSCTLAVLLLSLLATAVARADNPYLYGIHWWGYTAGQPVDNTPAQLLDAPAHGGWSLETVITHSSSWWQASYFSGLYSSLSSQNVSIITRVDYDWGQTVPSPTNSHYAGWPSHVVNNVVNVLKHGSHIWLIGNEPNIIGEGDGWPDNKVTPAGYAQIYRDVRNAIHNSAQASPHGPHIVLVAAPSPGGVIGGVRWMDGNQWLGEVLDHIPNDEVDGIAIHAYGGGITGFEASYKGQLQLIDSKGLEDKPVYLTEWNQVSSEASMAQFLRDAFASVHNWNQTVGNHNIVSMCWFIYDADQQAGGAWNSYSIEYYRNNGIPLGDPDNLFTAFEQTVDLRYPAGVVGVRGLSAAFSAAPTLGRIPLTVQFTNESIGIVDTNAWTFGDGGTSAEANPLHTYTAPGLYTVTLEVTGPEGTDIETKDDLIRVLPPPGDMDGDYDADMDDYGLFQACLSGANVAQTDPACELAKLDADSDVDAADLSLFIGCMSGAEIPIDPNCLP